MACARCDVGFAVLMSIIRYDFYSEPASPPCVCVRASEHAWVSAVVCTCSITMKKRTDALRISTAPQIVSAIRDGCPFLRERSGDKRAMIPRGCG